MTGWATPYVDLLLGGQTVQFRPRGRSMSGRIEDGDLVTVVPNKAARVGDAVLCEVRGKQWLHLVKQIDETDPLRPRFLIGNNRGVINGWTTLGCVYGVVTKVEP